MIRRRRAREQAKLDRLNNDLPRYCNASFDDRGNVRVHFRRAAGQPKLRLREEPLTLSFYQEVEEAKVWRHGSAAWRRRRSVAPLPKLTHPASTTLYTLGWLVERYYKADEYKKLKNRRPRQLVLESMLNEHVTNGDPTSPLIRDMPLAVFDDRHVRALMLRKVHWVEPVPQNAIDEDDQEPVQRGTEAANSRVKALRAVFGFGFVAHRDIVKDNWAQKINLLRPSVNGFHCWSLDEIEQYRNFHHVGTKQRLAFELLYGTGQRRGDIVHLSRLQLKGATWEVKQEKNRGTEREMTAYIPITRELQEIIAASREAGILGESIYLVSERGTHFTKESFGNWFREACDKAGLYQCSAHGLRKAFVVEMIERELTPQQIMSITGHQTQKEFDRYARNFRRRKSSLQAHHQLNRERGLAIDPKQSATG